MGGSDRGRGEVGLRGDRGRSPRGERGMAMDCAYAGTDGVWAAGAWVRAEAGAAMNRLNGLDCILVGVIARTG